jgi:hypothetical protein
MPEPRYFSISSTVVGAVDLRNEALNWRPCARSLIQLPLRLDELAGRDHRSMPKDSDQIALASSFDTQHAEAVLGVVKGDVIDQTGQDLGWRARFGRLHHPCKMNKKNSTCQPVKRSRLARSRLDSNPREPDANCGFPSSEREYCASRKS